MYWLAQFTGEKFTARKLKTFAQRVQKCSCDRHCCHYLSSSQDCSWWAMLVHNLLS
jgi:hypothetical protein